MAQHTQRTSLKPRREGFGGLRDPPTDGAEASRKWKIAVTRESRCTFFGWIFCQNCKVNVRCSIVNCSWNWTPVSSLSSDKERQEESGCSSEDMRKETFLVKKEKQEEPMHSKKEKQDEPSVFEKENREAWNERSSQIHLSALVPSIPRKMHLWSLKLFGTIGGILPPQDFKKYYTELLLWLFQWF